MKIKPDTNRDLNRDLNRVLDRVASACDVSVPQIKSRKRSSRLVSHAKMLFCWTAWDGYKVPQCDIARFLGCPKENVYWLIGSAQRNLECDKEFRAIHCEVSFCLFA